MLNISLEGIDDFVTDWMSSCLIPGEWTLGWARVTDEEKGDYDYSAMSMIYYPGYIVIAAFAGDDVIDLDGINEDEHIIEQTIEKLYYAKAELEKELARV